jgi:hypothetical protein
MQQPGSDQITNGISKQRHSAASAPGSSTCATLWALESGMQECLIQHIFSTCRWKLSTFRLNVHIISHTHNDPGWLSSYVQYHRPLVLDGHVIGEQADGTVLVRLPVQTF